MSKKVLTSTSKWICWLIVFTLVVSCFPMKDWAETTTEQNKEQTSPLTEGQDAKRINQEIEKKQPDVQAPPVDPVEKGTVPTQQEENIQVTQNAAGDYTKKVYLDPVQRKDEQNKWQDISTNLEINQKEQTIEPQNAAIDVAFEQKTDEGSYVTVQDDTSKVEYKLEGGEGDQPFTNSTDVVAEHKENQVFYQNVLPSVELRNTVFDQSIKEDIILQKYEGFYKFRFQVATSLEAIINENGSISFKNKEGSTVFSVPKPYMTDSKVDKASGEPQISYDVHYELKKQDNGYQLTVVANKDWLTSNDRTYPVYIDPTLTLGASDDTFVSDAYPTTNYDKFWESASGYYSLKVGKYDSSSGTNYSYVKPDISKLQGSIVDSAKFNIYTAHSYSSAATNVWLDRVDGNWSPGSVTWNTKPGSTNIATTSTAKDQMASFDVLNTVKDWVAGTKPNYGFKLHENGNGQSYWKKFYASENSVNKPYLAVDYHYPTLSAPTGTVTSNNDGSGYANLSWNAVKGATGYRIKMFNGATYQTFNVGNVTSWSTKGKGIWPTADEIAAGKYQLHSDGKGTELSTYPSGVYSNAGTKYANSRLYYFRVSAIFPGGESDNSEAYTPIMPLNQPKATPFANSTGGDNGYVKLSWDEDPNAAGYKVWIYNGKNYESFDVGNITTWTTQGKGIWPTADEITSGRYLLHTDGKGTELAKDPSQVYKNSGGRYPDNTNYWFRVTAYGSQGESVLSSPAMPKMPGLEANYLGMEDFWASFEILGGTVNAFNGNFVFDETDFSLSGRGPGINISRFYNSLDKDIGIFGKGWNSSLDIKVKEESNGDVLLIEQDKRIHRFRKQADEYQAPTGIYLTLTKDSNGFYFESTNQDIIAFRSDGKLDYQKDANGNKTTFSYVNGKIASITDASARSVSLSYTGNFVSKITYENQVTTFTYNGDELIESKTPNGRTYKYGYEDGKLRFIYDPKHTVDKPSVTEYEYDNVGKLIKVTDTLKRVTSVSYDTDARKTTVTNPKGSKDIYAYNEDGNPLSTIIDSNNLKLTTTYDYDNNNLIKQIDPKDQQESSPTTSYTYDNSGNVLTSTDAYGTERYEYNKNNDIVKITSQEGDPNSDSPEDKKESTIAYDNVNAISETDQGAKTSSISNYDSFGNIIETSDDLSTANNLVTNPGFEASLDTEWIKKSSADDGSFSAVTDSAPGSFSGDKVLSIQPQRKTDAAEGTHSYIAATQTITGLEGGKTYTLSALVKGDQLKNAYAFFNVYKYKGTEFAGSESSRFNKITGNTKWKERQFTFKTDPGTTKAVIYLEVESHKGPVSGAALFDNIQVEEGPVSSNFNVVTNSGFEQNDAGWVKSIGSSAEGPTKWAIENEGFGGEQSISLERTSTGQATVNIQQDITLNQTTARNITLTGLSKAENVKNSDNKLSQDYSLWAYVTFKDGSTGNYKAMFPLGTHDWSRSAVTINSGDLNKSIQKIRIHAIFRNAFTGKVYFDDIRLLEDNQLTRYTYDSNKNYLNKITDEKGNTQQFSYDEYGNKTAEINPKGQIKNYQYNLDNQLTKVNSSNTSIEYEYNPDGEMAKKIIKSGTKTQILNYEYDLENNLVASIDALNNKTSYSYDNNGNQVKMVTPDNHSIEWGYDTADRVTNEKRDGALAFTYEYDANGQETKVSDVINNTNRTKSYDQSGQLVGMKDRGGSFEWKYKSGSDKLVELSFSHSGISKKTNYYYNSLDQNIEVVDSKNKHYRFNYDEKGNVRTYSTGNDSGSTYSYDAAGKLISLDIGTANNDNILSESYKYDENNNKTEVNTYKNDGTLDSTLSYEYDSIDQLIKETLSNGVTKEYTYDGFGNRTSVTVKETGKAAQQTNAEFNTANELVKYGLEEITYDKNGNRLTDGKYKYTWNAANQLTSITKIGETKAFATYKYDNNDRRIEKKVNDKVTHFFYDGEDINPLYETDENGNVIRSYVYSDNGMRLSMETNGANYYYHYNSHGDVIALTDETGKIVVKYTYDAWGNSTKYLTPGENDPNSPFTYAGYMQDEETGMYYLIARYYQPNQGVFLSKDPQPGENDNPISQNGYTYTNNNPVMYSDPDGNNPAIIAVCMAIVRFAGPLLRKYGWGAARSIARFAKNQLNRFSKNYIIETNVGNSIVKVRKKKGKGDRRIFSLDHHPITLYNKKGKRYKPKVWHYHIKNPAVHYVFRWSVPHGWYLPKGDKNYKLV
ncbi:DNRLRE domain-containing protein [Priestia sp. JV24]|uniref:DNRLRE domain-containing protein n=1 Tax=Priestia TaxID=2800373 RepID=UPI0021D67AD9|nr:MULTISPECIES: DNRLRE domain-containing protein [Priestia]MCU7712677.1 DNRLRE domain-containing protein [Priestia megaterium]MCW1049080.1 DNRLRE domain-containing protein [Priestia sp. JV24]